MVTGKYKARAVKAGFIKSEKSLASSTKFGTEKNKSQPYRFNHCTIIDKTIIYKAIQ